MIKLSKVLLVVVVAALPACRDGGGGDGAPERRTLIDSRDTDDPRSLDPARSTDVPTGRAVAYVFDGLVRFTPDARVEPALAERWEISPNGLVYTFHLRRGVTFHDGRPFKAQDVVRSFTRVLSAGDRPWPLEPIRGAPAVKAGNARTVTGLRAPNDSTVVITLSEPLAFFIKLLAMPVASIVPDSLPENFGEHPIGTGPWRFVEWRHDDYILFARNESYFGGPPRADSLMARIIPEASTSVAEFESGAVDVLFVPEGETERWRDDVRRSELLQSAPGLRFLYVGMNTRRPFLSDVRVRQAINHAVDVPTILEQMMGGRGRRAAGVIPPSLEGADTLRRGYAFDVAKAKQLLTESGHPGGIDLELWHSQDATMSRLAQTIQNYLAVAGIRAKLVQRDGPSVREAARAGQVDLVLKDWWADYPDAENFLYPLLHTANGGAGGNVSFYSNPRFDQVVMRARRELRDSVRTTLYRQADSLAFIDAPVLYLFFTVDLFAVQPWVHGFEVPVMFNSQRWTNATIGADAGNRPAPVPTAAPSPDSAPPAAPPVEIPATPPAPAPRAPAPRPAAQTPVITPPPPTPPPPTAPPVTTDTSRPPRVTPPPPPPVVSDTLRPPPPPPPPR